MGTSYGLEFGKVRTVANRHLAKLLKGHRFYSAGALER